MSIFKLQLYFISVSGIVFANAAVVNNVSSVLSMVIVNSVYAASVNTMNGLVFIILVACQIVGMFIVV